MNIVIEIDEKELRKIIQEKLIEMLPNTHIATEDVKIEVKSKQNYKSEWEQAAFKATYIKTL